MKTQTTQTTAPQPAQPAKWQVFFVSRKGEHHARNTFTNEEDAQKEAQTLRAWSGGVYYVKPQPAQPAQEGKSLLSLGIDAQDLSNYAKSLQGKENGLDSYTLQARLSDYDSALNMLRKSELESANQVGFDLCKAEEVKSESALIKAGEKIAAFLEKITGIAVADLVGCNPAKVALQPAKWTAQPTDNAKNLGLIEVENGESFYILETQTHLVFGGACNAGFLESGNMEKQEGETTDQALRELIEELETFYRDGIKYCTRILCNDRM